MNKLLKFGGLGLSSVAVLGWAMVLFGALLGAEMHRLPLLGGLFAEPEPEPVELGAEPEEGEAADGESAEAASVAAPIEPSQARFGILDSFTFNAPHTSAELEELTEKLRTKLRGLEAREAQLEESEQSLADRAALLDERHVAYQEIEASLDEREARLGVSEEALALREGQVRADEAAGWTKVASAFKEGDAADLVDRLLTYDANEAAELLHALSKDRASELLGALPVDRYREYADAYQARPDAD